MRLFIGLGNPGIEYMRTRHNIGFMLVEKIAEKINFHKKSNSFISMMDGVILAMPQTYMNKSGEAIGQIARFYKIDITNIYVAHDDIDLELGKIKIKIGGGSGGHNGLKSIDQHIGPNYMRIRLGIGRPQYGNVSDYVLQNFKENEVYLVEKMLNFIKNNFDDLIKCDHITDRIGHLLNKYS